MNLKGNADPASTPRVLNIGIYGCTRAGKTRFLFELLRYWEQSRRILVASAPCQQFLKTVEAEIEKHGDSMPTAAVSPEITVTIERGDKESPWQITFRDLRGELLTDELDGIESLAVTGMVSSQVNQCDAFLFLFDPAASNPGAAMDQHHEHELRRAELFVTYVRDRRQNHYLPIAFVQTHADIWSGDADMSAAARKWRERVHGILLNQYQRLRRHFPSCLTDPDRIFFATAAAEASDEARSKLELVIEQLFDARKAIDTFKKTDRKRQMTIAVAAASLMTVMGALVVGTMLSAPTSQPQRSKPTGRGRDLPPRPTSDKEALGRAKAFRKFIAQLPTGVQVAGETDASMVSSELQWLCSECDPTQSPTTARLPEVRESLAEAVRAASQYLLALANRGDVPANERCEFLSLCLKSLPDGAALGVKELAATQEAFWKLASADLTTDLAEILRRRREVASPAIQAIEEVAAELAKRKAEWDGNDIARDPQHDFIGRLEDALTFCEDRKKSGTYGATIRVDASQNLGGDSPLTPRVLRISTPGRGTSAQVAEMRLVPNDGRVPLDITPEVQWGRKCWDGYENKVVFSCEGVDHVRSSVKSVPEKTTALAPFRISLPHDRVDIHTRVEVTSSVFVWSYRNHGEGTLECSAGDLLASPQTLTLKGTGANGNTVTFKATSAEPLRRSGFHTEQTEYQASLGLGAPIDCRIYLATEDTRVRHSFDAAKDPGPLAPLGLPLLRDRQKSEIKHVHEENGFTIEVRFASLPLAPALLWDAALLASEKNDE